MTKNGAGSLLLRKRTETSKAAPPSTPLALGSPEPVLGESPDLPQLRRARLGEDPFQSTSRDPGPNIWLLGNSGPWEPQSQRPGQSPCQLLQEGSILSNQGPFRLLQAFEPCPSCPRYRCFPWESSRHLETCKGFWENQPVRWKGRFSCFLVDLLWNFRQLK